MSQTNYHSAVESKRKSGGPINIKPSEKGTLHTAMGVKQGNTISTKSETGKLATAKKDGDVSLEKKLVFALNMKK